MSQILLRFTGILAIFVSWLFVVAPAICYGIDIKKETIRAAATKDRNVSRFVSFGLVLGALLQGFFLLYLIQKFQLTLISVGSLMYITSNIATILVALFHYRQHSKIHEVLAKYYFVTNPLSIGFIGFSVMKHGSNLFIFSLIVVLLYFVGTCWLTKKFNSKNALLEIWAFFVLSIWTIVFTIV